MIFRFRITAFEQFVFFFLSVLLCFSSISFLIPISIHAEATITGVSPPFAGDWVITSNTTVSGETIILNGSIYVNEMYELKIVDSTIYINCSNMNGENGITVKGNATHWGVLNITGNSKILNYTKGGPPHYRFYFRVYGILYTSGNVEIQGAGWSGGKNAGIYVNHNGSVIEDLVVHHGSFSGVYIEDARDVNLRNVTTHDVTYYGFEVVGNSSATFENCTSYQVGHHGFGGGDYSNITILNSITYDSDRHGFEFYGNVLVTIRNSQANTNGMSGFRFLQNTKGTVENSISGPENGFHAFEIMNSANVTIKNCTGYNNAQRGLFAYGSTITTLNNVNLYGNNYDVYLKENAHVRMYNVYFNNITKDDSFKTGVGIVIARYNDTRKWQGYFYVNYTENQNNDVVVKKWFFSQLHLNVTLDAPLGVTSTTNIYCPWSDDHAFVKFDNGTYANIPIANQLAIVSVSHSIEKMSFGFYHGENDIYGLGLRAWTNVTVNMTSISFEEQRLIILEEISLGQIATTKIYCTSLYPYSVRINGSPVNKNSDWDYDPATNTMWVKAHGAPQVTIEVSWEKPELKVLKPTPEAKLSGSVEIVVNITQASDIVADVTIQILKGSEIFCAIKMNKISSTEWYTNWDTTKVPDGSYTIRAKVITMSGDVQTFDLMQVQVDQGSLFRLATLLHDPTVITFIVVMIIISLWALTLREG